MNPHPKVPKHRTRTSQQSHTLLKRFKADKGLNVDRTFAKKVLTPGDWQLAWGDVKGVVGENVTWSSKTDTLLSNLF